MSFNALYSLTQFMIFRSRFLCIHLTPPVAFQYPKFIHCVAFARFQFVKSISPIEFNKCPLCTTHCTTKANPFLICRKMRKIEGRLIFPALSLCISLTLSICPISPSITFDLTYYLLRVQTTYTHRATTFLFSLHSNCKHSQLISPQSSPLFFSS